MSEKSLSDLLGSLRITDPDIIDTIDVLFLWIWKWFVIFKTSLIFSTYWQNHYLVGVGWGGHYYSLCIICKCSLQMYFSKLVLLFFLFVFKFSVNPPSLSLSLSQNYAIITIPPKNVYQFRNIIYLSSAYVLYIILTF